MQIKKEPINISIVIPVYNEEKNLPTLYDRIINVFNQLEYDFELILVDDGSFDKTLEVAEQLHLKDPRIKILSLSRNFGHQVALTAGLDYAQGGAVIMMDGDLQHPPEYIPLLLEKWREGYENVYTIRKIKQPVSLFKKYSSKLFYRFFRLLTRLDLPQNSADFRLLDKKIVAHLKEMKEKCRFLRGLIYWTGFKSIGIEYNEENRFQGKRKYNLMRMTFLAMDAMTSFTIAPLYASVIVGIFFAFFSFSYLIYAVVLYLFSQVTISGWASMICLLGLLGGIILMVLGLVGIYIGKIFEEVKARPLYFIRQEKGFKK